MQVADLVLRYLSLFLTWPVLLFTLVLVFRKKVREVLERLLLRLTRAEVGGHRFEFISEMLLEQSSHLSNQDRRLEQQETVLRNLVAFSMATPIFEHLVALYHRPITGEPYHYVRNEFFKRDLYFLRDHGYIESTRPQILEIEGLQDGADLLKEVKLTPAGKFLVELRESMEDWRRKPAA